MFSSKLSNELVTPLLSCLKALELFEFSIFILLPLLHTQTFYKRCHRLVGLHQNLAEQHLPLAEQTF